MKTVDSSFSASNLTWPTLWSNYQIICKDVNPSMEVPNESPEGCILQRLSARGGFVAASQFSNVSVHVELMWKTLRESIFEIKRFFQ